MPCPSFLAERKALLSMVVTLERALSTAGLGEEYDEMCGEARALITASRDHDHSTCSALENALTVETAAIRIGEAVFTLPRPNRHHNVMWWLHVLGITSGQMHDQGFVLSDETYADRQRAYGVAKEAGQLIGDPPVPGTLFSEDLWDGGADLPNMEVLKALGNAAPQKTHLTAGDKSREASK